MNSERPYQWAAPQRPRTQSTLLEKVQAVLILLGIAAIIVGACIWFFAYDSPAVANQKDDPPPFEPAKNALPQNFKP